MRAQARSQATVVAATAPELLAAERRGELDRLARNSARSVRGRVIIVDSRGLVVADSAAQGRVGQDYSDRPEIRVALNGRTTQETRHSRTLDRELLATAVPVLRAGRPAGAVRITQGVDAVGRAVRRAILGLALVGVVVLAIGFVAGALIAGQIARPIRRLERAAVGVAEGDLDARAPVEGSTEQRSLAHSFNDMTTRLGRMLRGQRDFVADASHQLRTPLTALRLRLEEAAERTDEPDVVEQMEAATREVDRLADMVAELLVLSRAGERELPGESLDLGLAAERAVERWRATAADAGLRLESRVSSPRRAWCAEADLDRALDSLLENAVRYSPAGTTITVAARASSIEVLDEGPGLESGEEEVVFERFHRGRAGRRGPSGTGLGLPIARELAREWGGNVSLASRPQGGARAVLELPADRGEGR